MFSLFSSPLSTSIEFSFAFALALGSQTSASSHWLLHKINPTQSNVWFSEPFRIRVRFNLISDSQSRAHIRSLLSHRRFVFSYYIRIDNLQAPMANWNWNSAIGLHLVRLRLRLRHSDSDFTFEEKRISSSLGLTSSRYSGLQLEVSLPGKRDENEHK